MTQLRELPRADNTQDKEEHTQTGLISLMAASLRPSDINVMIQHTLLCHSLRTYIKEWEDCTSRRQRHTFLACQVVSEDVC